MKINEIFYSIQGESSFAGLPFAFVRLTGCNLRCNYCDTEYAFHEGSEMSISEIMQKIESFPTRYALVTGGEPMLQKSVHELFSRLLAGNYTVLLETGGQAPLKEVDPRVHKIMDFKCPGSGMERYNRYENVDFLTKRDEVKFVITDRKDFDWACDVVRRYDLLQKVSTVLCSPVFEKLPFRDLADWILNSGIPLRMQVQLHKVIWPDISRGR